MTVDSSSEAQLEPPRQSSLGTAAARNLATTTKSVPQMREITSRWLLRMLPWVETEGGVYRVNRRLTHTVGDGRVEFVLADGDRFGEHALLDEGARWEQTATAETPGTLILVPDAVGVLENVQIARRPR